MEELQHFLPNKNFTPSRLCRLIPSLSTALSTSHFFPSFLLNPLPPHQTVQERMPNCPNISPNPYLGCHHEGWCGSLTCQLHSTMDQSSLSWTMQTPVTNHDPSLSFSLHISDPHPSLRPLLPALVFRLMQLLSHHPVHYRSAPASVKAPITGSRPSPRP